VDNRGGSVLRDYGFQRTVGVQLTADCELLRFAQLVVVYRPEMLRISGRGGDTFGGRDAG
jgi:hypothetical protein